MKKIIILIFALVFSLFIPNAFAFSQAETLEYYQENYLTQEIQSGTLLYENETNTNNYIEFQKMDLNYLDIYINDILVFSDNLQVDTTYFEYISIQSGSIYFRQELLVTSSELVIYNLEINDPDSINFQVRSSNVILLNFTFVDKSIIIIPPTFAESIFLNVTDIIVGFGSLLGALFILIANIFYNESLTIVGILALLGIGLSFTYWGFRTILRLLKIKRE